MKLQDIEYWDQGERVRKTDWEEGKYIYFNITLGIWMYNDDREFYIISPILLDANWELFKD